MEQCDILLEGKVIKTPGNKIMAQGWRADVHLRRDSEGALLAMSFEDKLFLMVFIDKCREKSICQINSAYHVFICSSSETRSDPAAAIEVTTRLGFQ